MVKKYKELVFSIRTGDEFKSLQKYINHYNLSYAEIARRLGYRSDTTVYKWFANNKLPRIAKNRVRDLLLGKLR